MPNSTPDTSLRFSRAASAESKRLRRKVARLLEKREDLEEAIRELDLEVKVLEDRIGLLGELASNRSAPNTSGELGTTNGKRILRGASIREIAVPLLIREMGESPVHYKHWYELLESAGFAVLGQRPDAVFLNQVTRSPLVKASTQPGIYSIDFEAVERLRSALEAQEDRLRGQDSSPTTPPGAGASAEKQRELAISVNRLRKQLDEADRALSAAQDRGPRLAEAA